MSFATQEFNCTIEQAAVLLEIMTDAGDKVMLWGAPGIGKTDIMHQLGAKKKRPVREFHAALREQVDLRGIPVPDLVTGTTRWLVPDELPRADRDGPEGYLFCDEYNQASPQVQSALGGLVLYGVCGDYTLPSGWIVVAAGNRISDKASAQRMPTHVRNRFAHINIVPDVEAWCSWANANGISPELVAFQRLRAGEHNGAGVLHVMPKGDENAYPTPRSWTKASKYVNAPKHLRMRLMAAHVGQAYATEFDGFIELYRSLGDLADIIKSPKTAKVPTEPSTRYAVCTGLARMATKQNLPAIITYANRLPRESQVLVVHDATLRDAALKNTQAYGAWAVEHQATTIQ